MNCRSVHNGYDDLMMASRSTNCEKQLSIKVIEARYSVNVGRSGPGSRGVLGVQTSVGTKINGNYLATTSRVVGSFLDLLFVAA